MKNKQKSLEKMYLLVTLYKNEFVCLQARGSPKKERCSLKPSSQ